MTSTVDSALPESFGATASSDAIRDAVKATCARIAPLWPLERFVAVNPYLGMADHRFVDAAALLARTAGASGTMAASYYLTAVDEGRIDENDLAAALADVTPLGSHAAGTAPDVAGFLAAARAAGDDDSGIERVPTVAAVATATTGRDWSRLATERASTWAASYFDQGQAMWRAADRSLPLFTAWKEEAEVDRTPEVMGLAGFRAVVRELPDDAPSAIQAALDELGVPAEAIEAYLHAVLLGVGGWSAHAARLVWDQGLLGHDDDTLEQFLAVLLGWEVGLLRTLATQGVATAWQEATLRSERADEPAVPEALARRLVLQYAFDRAEQLRVAALLSSLPNQAPPAADDRPQVQAVFCIDVRSEVFRRHLEAAGDVSTIGFAGFFGFPVEYVPIAHDSSEAQLPVLLTAAHTVYETVPDAARQEEAVARRRQTHHVRRAWKSFKMGAISCFSFVGPVGLIYLPKLFSDSYGWTRPVPNPEDEGLASWAVEAKGPGLAIGEANQIPIPLDDRIQLAEGALRAMSLTNGFAPLVLVSGHGATTVNNPYDTGLDCGACGGHTGEANARIAAAVLDDPEVRVALAGRGVVIPTDTWFVAGQHNTTTDEVTVYDRHLVPATHTALVTELVEHLAEAGRRTRAERAGRLGIAPGASVDGAVMRRASEWAQVRPEWGLAGCRAFVVAPRYRTQGLDLGGRSFLHSYDWRQDEGFGVLNLIMTAPMVVASWINLQYYASTVDNTLFGSGNKTLHNVVGRLGVLEGNAGDLRVGLPWQSLHDGDTLQHEPLRLNVVIEAPMSAMNDVLAANPGVRDLCDNDWVHLLAMDDNGVVSHRYVGALQWEPIGLLD